MRRTTVIFLALAALAASAGPAHALPDEPDLVIRLPGQPTSGEAAPVFVDAFELPGKLLYRFNTVIANQGGTLDLFRGPDGGVQQAVWPGGVPSVKPRPDVTPSGPEVRNRSGFGSTFSYAIERTHKHFHFSSAARYSLQPAAGAERVSDKVGFCLLDSLYPNPDKLFDYDVQGPGGETWCGFYNPDQAAVRMGLSPGGGDIYYAQQERQWVDITGVAPGPMTVKAEANPLRCILESNTANNQTTESRQIPGVRVADVAGGTSLVLSGSVVAPEVPARKSGGCTPGSSQSCYVWGSASGPLAFRVVGEPAHGTVALAPGVDGLHAAATYTPDPGFAGEDSFAYVAVDARGLTSAPATARVRVDAPRAGGRCGRGACSGSHDDDHACGGPAVRGARGQAARPLSRRAAGQRPGPALGSAGTAQGRKANGLPAPFARRARRRCPHGARPPRAGPLPPAPARRRAFGGQRALHRPHAPPLLDWKAVWLPSDT